MLAFHGRLLTLLASILFCLTVPTLADDPLVEDQDARIRALENRIRQLEPAAALRDAVPGERADGRLETATQVEPTNYDDEPEDAPTSEFEERLEKLEGKVFAPVTAPTFDIGGRIHADYWGFPSDSEGAGFFEHPNPASSNFGIDPEDRYLFRRIRLEMKGDIFETMLWRMQIDFNTPAAPEIKDVFIGFKELPANQTFLIGNQKRPIGLDHLNSSRFNVFIERPLVVEAFNEDARRPGATFYGFTDDESLGWAYGMYGLTNISRINGYRGDALQLSANGRLWGSPWYDECSGGRGYFHWAVAGMVADPDGEAGPGENSNEGRFRTRPEARTNSRWIDTGRVPGADTYEILALESILNVGPMQIVGEYQFTWMQRDDFTPGTGPDLFFHGAYVYASYLLTGEHVPYTRDRGTIGRVKPFENFFLVNRCCGDTAGGWGAWQVALRLSYLDLTSEDVLGGYQENVTFGLNWWWTSHSKVQFNLVYGDIRNREPVGGFTDANFLIAGIRFAADF